MIRYMSLAKCYTELCILGHLFVAAINMPSVLSTVVRQDAGIEHVRKHMSTHPESIQTPPAAMHTDFAESSMYAYSKTLVPICTTRQFF